MVPDDCDPPSAIAWYRRPAWLPQPRAHLRRRIGAIEGADVLGAFIASLMAEGRVEVSPEVPGADPDTAIEAAVMGLARRAGLECPGVAPQVDLAAAMQAIRVLYRACQVLVFRDMEVGGVPAIDADGPSGHWSIDVAFRHLPAVWKQAHARAAGDPLVAWIAEVVRPWPLSAVGIPLQPLPDPAPILDHPVLGRAYLDRCLAGCDGGRLGHPRMRSAVRAAIGAYPAILPSPVATIIAEAQP
jgi:hypothetical protein